MPGRRPLVLFHLAVAALVAGCVDPGLDGPAEAADMGGPRSSPETGAPPGVVESDAPPPLPGRANITACKGVNVAVQLPTSWVAAHVPPPYRVSTISGAPLTQVFLDVQRCDKVALDGVDAGPADVALLTIPIASPATVQAVAKTVDRYVFESFTNNAAYAAWMQGQNATARLANVSYSFLPLAEPLTPARLFGNVTNATGALYEFQGTSDAWFHNGEYPTRLFHGPDPARDHWVGKVTYRTSNAGVASLWSDPHSGMATLSRGQETLLAGTQPMPWTQFQLERPGVP